MACGEMKLAFEKKLVAFREEGRAFGLMDLAYRELENLYRNMVIAGADMNATGREVMSAGRKERETAEGYEIAEGRGGVNTCMKKIGRR
jgi:hypothetical protein